MKLIFSAILVYLFLPMPLVMADTSQLKVKFLSDVVTSPEAEIADLAWMEGHWVNRQTEDSFAGHVEHIILAPLDGQMPGLVRVMNKDETYMLFELSSFMEVDGTLSYRNRHFGPDQVAWQDPDDFVDRRLVELGNETAIFDGITFAKNGPDQLLVAFVLTDDEGNQSRYGTYYDRKETGADAR